MPALNPLAFASYDFETAARAVLEYLHTRFGFGIWMITRVEGENSIMLQAEDYDFGIEPNSVFRWADSYCSRMVDGRGPRIAPQSRLVPAYLEAPHTIPMGIHSYVGVPLSFGDGKLFGTLCAIDRQPQPETLNNELPLLELLAAMLSGILDKELAATEAARHAERLQAEAETDALTGLFNRRGWDRVLDAEDARCRRYGHPACVIAVDLDGLKAVNDFHGHAAGDKLIFDAGAAIKSAARESDVVARVGGDEFAILAVESDAGACRQLQHRIDSALARAGIEASLGLAMRHPMKGFSHAWQQADRAMYAVKASKPPRYRGALAATLSLTSPRVN